jgi:hypothetical protein
MAGFIVRVAIFMSQSSCYEKFKVQGSKFKVNVVNVGCAPRTMIDSQQLFIIYGWAKAHEELSWNACASIFAP